MFCPLFSKHRIVAIPGRLNCCEAPEDDCQMVLDHLTKFASRRQTIEVVIMVNASSHHGQTTKGEGDDRTRRQSEWRKSLVDRQRRALMRRGIYVVTSSKCNENAVGRAMFRTL